jgi:general secretion pathway protein A
VEPLHDRGAHRGDLCAPRLENFCWRIEHAQIREGGFAMIHGDPGTGKSVALRLLAERLARLPDVTVGAITHPQSNLADFYREMGDSLACRCARTTAGAASRRCARRWFAHLESTRRRPVLLIDEAQEMSPAVLSELRLMASAKFDSQSLLCVVLAGDARLPEKLRREELIPLGSRIRTRLATEAASREELLACLQHMVSAAGNASLMSAALMHTLCDHAVGNYRILTTMAAWRHRPSPNSIIGPSNSVITLTQPFPDRPRLRRRLVPSVADEDARHACPVARSHIFAATRPSPARTTSGPGSISWLPTSRSRACSG